jgi:ABC-type glycerol-3-phosphate transport system permease component
MDQELRDEFRQLRETQRADMAELRAVIGNVSERFQLHVESSASRWSEVDQRARAAHARIDEHIAEHGSWRKLTASVWIAVATTLISSVVTVLVAFAGKK